MADTESRVILCVFAGVDRSVAERDVVLTYVLRHLEENGFKDWVDVRLYHNYDCGKTPPDAHIAEAARQAFVDMDMKPYTVTLTQGSARRSPDAYPR